VDNPLDGRTGPSSSPANKLTNEERNQVIQYATSKEFMDKTPWQIVPTLADRGLYIASEATFYRILKEEKMLAHRGKSKPRTNTPPAPLIAVKPNQVWSWDITYVKSSIKGKFYYLYMIMDIYSRKIVGWSVHESECMEFSADLISETCLLEKILENQLSLHADNGGPMKGATMLATLQKLKVVSSFSRPSVSDDNPYSEALFKTLKYCPEYPSNPFESLEAVEIWVQKFVDWYNGVHLHSGIKFVTPNDRHSGKDKEILKARELVYEKARKKQPLKWSKDIRNWDMINEVQLNPLRAKEKEDKKEAA
jgi:transposase InsO family protein